MFLVLLGSTAALISNSSMVTEDERMNASNMYKNLFARSFPKGNERIESPSCSYFSFKNDSSQ